MNIVPLQSQESKDQLCVVKVTSLSKKLCRNLKWSLIYALEDLARQLCAMPLGDSLKKHEFWALRDIKLEINAGETLAIIGRNGAGKTTLLKLVAGLIKPNQGSIAVRGRVVALIALGAGFSPYLTGKENADAFLTLLGVASNHRRERLAEIFSFAELILFQNDPLTSYSSGMIARLAFACAVHADPDVLLIDEVLAVGDLSFHLRCYQKLSQLKRSGVAIVLVSHNLTSVVTLADRAVYLERGTIKSSGLPVEVCSQYEEDLRKAETSVTSHTKISGKNNSKCILSNFQATSGSTAKLRCGLPGCFHIEVQQKYTKQELAVTLLIKQSSQADYTLFLSSEDSPEVVLATGKNLVTISIPYCGLLPGHYQAKVSVIDKRSREILAIQDWQTFEVTSGIHVNQSQFYQPSTWHTTGKDEL